MGATWPAQPSPDLAVARFLRGFAISAFREYDLLTGCKCLRALIHLDCLDDAKDLATFVARQQRPDGSFGFLGPEQAELDALAAWVDSDTALYLPMTVQCLWSLAEWYRQDWRLFRDIPAVA